MNYFNPYATAVNPYIAPQPQPQQQPQNQIIWVQGEAGAKAYPVAAGSSVLLMDSESSVFYLKSTDMSGMPMPLRTFTYNEVVSQPQEQVSQTADYASKSDIEKLSAEIEALREQIGKKKEK